MNENEIIKILHNEKIDTIVSLPCDRTRNLCALLESEFTYIPISREEDGIGICSGLALTKKRSVLHMQSSGLGNSLNAIMTLPFLYNLPILILASWRGIYEEKIVAQIPFNVKIPELLKLYEIDYTIINESYEISLIKSAIQTAFSKMRPHIILLSPKIWGTGSEACNNITKIRDSNIKISYSCNLKLPSLTRFEAIKGITEVLTDEYVISNIGVPGKELYAACDRDRNFYMLGSFSQATPIGLGIAIGTEKEVIVIDGDGSMLYSACMPTIGAINPKNLTIVLLDNGVYGSTGNQCSPAWKTTNIELIARACNINNTVTLYSKVELQKAIKKFKNYGPSLIRVIIKPGNSKVTGIPKSPIAIRNRFMNQFII